MERCNITTDREEETRDREEVSERLEEGSIRFHESISLEEKGQEKEKQKMLEGINHKYKN